MTTNIRTACKVNLGLDDSTGMIFPLTECCAASAKGSSATHGGPAVVCRRCYQEVDDAYGLSVIIDFELADLLNDFGCPCPQQCADETMWHFELAQEQESLAIL